MSNNNRATHLGDQHLVEVRKFALDIASRYIPDTKKAAVIREAQAIAEFVLDGKVPAEVSSALDPAGV